MLLQIVYECTNVLLATTEGTVYSTISDLIKLLRKMDNSNNPQDDASLMGTIVEDCKIVEKVCQELKPAKGKNQNIFPLWSVKEVIFSVNYMIWKTSQTNMRLTEKLFIGSNSNGLSLINQWESENCYLYLRKCHLPGFYHCWWRY